jgi:glutathione S-transferase
VHGASLVQQRVFIKAEERSPAVADLEGKRLMKTLEVLDQHLARRDYMLASGFSAADTAIGYSIHLGKGFRAIDQLAHVSAYYGRVTARPAFQQTLADDSAP